MKKKSKIAIIAAIAIIVLIGVFCGKDIYNMVVFIGKKDFHAFGEYVKGKEIKAFIVIGLLQFLQIVFAVLPSEFAQVAAFLCFKPLEGLLLIYASVVLGSVAVFFISKLFKKYKNIADVNDTATLIDNKYEKKNLALTVFLLYFLPAIPYGIISYYASSKKIGFFPFLLITMFGCIPSILLTFVATRFATHWYMHKGIVALIVIIIVILIIMLIKNYSDKLDSYFVNNTYHKPNLFLFWFFKIPICLFLKLKYKIKIDTKETKKKKGPYVLLSTHQDFYDFAFAGFVTNHRINTVTARYYFYNKHLRRLLTAMGAFPKDLFNQDISSIKFMMNTIKHGSILLMMPEGRLSTVGVNEEISITTAKLVKKLGVDVCGMKTSGAYYSLGKGFRKSNVGRIDLKSFVILTKEELKELSVEQIYDRIVSSLAYDEAKFMKENPELTYKHYPNLKNMPGLIYSCPSCGAKSSFITNKDSISCNSCGLTLSMDKRYNFIKDNKVYDYPSLKDIHYHDLEVVREIIKDDNFSIQANVKLRSDYGKNKKIIEVGSGKVTFNKDEFIYKGTFDNKERTLIYPSKELWAVPFAISDSFEIYRNGEFFAFCPIDNPNETIRWVMFIEENFKLRYSDERKG